MQKIVYVNGTTLLGGGPEHLYQLVKQLNPQEWEVVVCTRNDGPYWDKFRSLGIKVHDLALSGCSLYASLLATARRLDYRTYLNQS